MYWPLGLPGDSWWAVALVGLCIRHFVFKLFLIINILESILLYSPISGLYPILPKVLGHLLLMKDLTTLVISMSTNLNV